MFYSTSLLFFDGQIVYSEFIWALSKKKKKTHTDKRSETEAKLSACEM